MPKSRGRKRKPNRSRSTRPPRRSPHRSPLPPLDSLIRPVLRGGRELLDVQDPLDAEAWASQVLGLWFKMPLPVLDRVDFERRIRSEIVEAAERSGTPESLAVLRALAAMEPDPIALPARDAAHRLAGNGVADPPWAAALADEPELVDAWTLSDAYGDQDGYYVTFRSTGRAPHMVMALIDKNIGGIVKDAFCRLPTEDVRTRAETFPGAIVADVDLGAAAAAIVRAIEVGDQYLDNDWTDEFKDTRALLLARMTKVVPAALPESESLDDSSREAIVAEFVATARVDDDESAARIASACLDYACDYTPDGDPYRWSPIVVECFLLGWLPRKVMLGAREIRAMPAALKAWVEFALRRRGLPSDLMEETKDAVDRFMPEFRQAATDPGEFGPAKAITTAMMASGIDLRDQAAVDAWIEEFNRRPFHERDEFLGPTPGFE